jgi:hypothetical protein
VRLSVIVATVNRVTLDATLRSVASQRLPGDELVVVSADAAVRDRVAPYGALFVQADAPGYDWGATEKALGMQAATGDYIAFMDDDDTYADGARQAIERAAEKHPGRPLMFKMQFTHSREVIWRNKRVTEGNVGSPCLVAPNRPEMLGTWGRRYANDFEFFASMKWAADDVVWVPTVIALIGGCDGQRYRRISVLVPTRKRPALLRKMLKSFNETVLVPESAELVFRVDDDDPETLQLLQDETPWNVVLGPRHRGYGSLPSFFNEMAAVAKGELLMCGNDDMTFRTPDWPMRLLYEASKYPDGIFVLGVETYNPTHFPFAVVSKYATQCMGHFWNERLYWGDVYLRDVMAAFGRAVRLEGIRIDHNWMGKTPDDTFRESDQHNPAYSSPAYWEHHRAVVAETVATLREHYREAATAAA